MVTRVPETIGGTRELILAASDEWLKIRPERRLHGVGFKLWRR